MKAVAEPTNLQIRLHGPFALSLSDGTEIRLPSGKKQALFALLATAPEGRRTRDFLSEMLWSSHRESARLSLRGALSEIRRALGPAESVLESTNDDVRLAQGQWRITGGPEDGAFLEGLVVDVRTFQDWLAEQRCSGPRPAPRVATTLIELAEEPRATVAVLPFSAPLGDENTTMLGDMMAEETTRVLSGSRLLNVISYLSSRSTGGLRVSADQVRDKLGADYALSGRISSDGAQFRLSIDLSDLNTGVILWASDQTGDVNAFVAGNDHAATEITRMIGRVLLKSSLEVAASRPLHEVASHHLLISAVALMHRLALSSFARARPALEELIERTPRCAALHAWLGKWYVLSVAQGWSDRAAGTNMAGDCMKRALDLDPECGFALAVDGFVQSNLARRLDLAANRFEQALEHDPNNALAWLLKGNMHAFVDEGDAATTCAQRALMLSPADPHRYFFDSLSATAFLAAGQFEEAVQQCERSLKANPRHTSTLRARTIALQMMGRTAEAQDSRAELMQWQPKLTVADYQKNHPAAAYRTGQDWAEALRGAGVPPH